MKKILILLIILAYFNSYLGCMSTKQSTYSSSELKKSNRRDIEVVTKSSDKFIFKSYTYQTIGDTLVGQGRAIIDNEEQKLRRINIALSDIAYGVSKEEHLNTWSYIGIGLVAVSIIVISIYKDYNIPLDL